jgi:hypothetical protein
MILEQTLPIYFSITGVIGFVAVLFTIEFYVYKRAVIHSLYVIPSILFLGPKFSGKTSVMRHMSTHEPTPHAKDSRFHVSYMDEGKKIQLVEPQNFNYSDTKFLKSIKGMNYKSHIFVFDVSPFSDPIENQIKEYESVQKVLGGNGIVVANKTDMFDHEKLSVIRKNFKNIHEVSVNRNIGMNQLKNSILSSVEN